MAHSLDFSPRKRLSRRRRSASSGISDDDHSDPATDEVLSENATEIALKAAVGVNVQQLVDNESKDRDTERHAPVRGDFSKSDSDRIQTASVNEPYILLRAVSVVDKPVVADKGNGKAEKAAHLAEAPESAADTHHFQYDKQRLEKILADMDHDFRSKTFDRSRVYKKCPSRTLQEVETRSMQILREGEMAAQKRTKVSSKNKKNTNSTPPSSDGEDPRKAHKQTKRSRSPFIGVPLGAIDENEMTEIESESEEPSVVLTNLGVERLKMFIKLAKAMFRYFLPLEFNSALVAKYWGAVYVLIEVITPNISTDASTYVIFRTPASCTESQKLFIRVGRGRWISLNL